MAKKGIVLLLLLVVIAVSSGIYWSIDRTPAQQLSKERLQRNSDYQIEQFQLQRTNELGLVHQKLHAAQLIHYPEGDISELLKPELLLLNHDNPKSWYILSREATLHGKERMIFTNEVAIHNFTNVLSGQAERRHPEDMQLLTEILDVDMLQKSAVADATVTIMNDFHTITAGAMQLDIATGQIQLFNGVNTIYNQ